jgi:tight adherence protein C
MTAWLPLLITLGAFGCIAGIVFVLGRYLAGQAAVNRRLSASASGTGNVGAAEPVSTGVLASIASRVNERKFGIEGILRAKLRTDLIRAGYFSDAAIRGYVLIRLGAVIVIPTITFLIFRSTVTNPNFLIMISVVAVSALIGIIGPDAYLSRRRRLLQWEYRVTFPDLTDMLVVCVDAGLGLDGALNRIWPEVAKRNAALGTNMAILSVETRAGRSLSDALSAFAERLGLDEARSFATMLRQSLELGTDIGDALRVFSDEMRAKRLLRAEEIANQLPVKIVLPLGAFIFPVILMTVMVPTVIRLFYIFHTVH